jgi:hypothetical protein
MRHSSYYREQADHARQLAEMTVQQNVEELLHRVADELDQMAHDIAAGEGDLGDTETRNIGSTACPHQPLET